MVTWQTGEPFRATLLATAERDGHHVDDDRLSALFRPERYLERLGPVFDRLAQLR